MSDQIKHECGIALIRLRKPLEYYQIKYGTWMYGLRKLYLLMEKQHNRGQDGAGFVSLKINHSKGHKYFKRFRSNKETPIKDVFDKVNLRINEVEQINKNLINDVSWVKDNIDFAGELFLGHLRYGTFGNNSIDYVHPVMRENNWKSRNLVLAGNFNLTNVDELYKSLLELGQHPKDYSDTTTMLENIGHHLDETNQQLFEEYKKQGYSNIEISDLIATNINVTEILKESSKHWDGGYVIGGLIGHGDAFVMRDPWGIRPAYYYYDDEIVVVASERPVIQTVMNIDVAEINEINPGNALLIKRDGFIIQEKIRENEIIKPCSFERIYFSRGSDKDIYSERKKLGELLIPSILKTVDHDLKNTVFSFIPNTAEIAFYGMVKGAESYLKDVKKQKIKKLGNKITDEDLDKILDMRPKVEKIAIKDIKLRTFISQDSGRNDLVGHVYDVTYGVVKDNIDNLVIIDDSIVRGTTLRESIIKILDRLNPKTIIIVSSAPQIRYPDCYGIDMAKLNDFIAFRAAIELLHDTKQENIINEVYRKCKAQQHLPKEKIINHVKEIYKPFSAEEISDKIAQMLKTKDVKADIKIVYQSIENLHKAIPENNGDWYFTGNYPTPGGNKVVNTSFINFIEGKNQRAY